MAIDQISVFVENRPGRLVEITNVLGDANVDMRAMSIADTTDFGILRLIVDKPEAALSALREAEYVSSVTQVVAVRIEDKPGSLSAVLKKLAEGNVSIEYLYAFITRKTDAAYVVFRLDDNELGEQLLLENGFSLASPDEIFSI